MILGRIPVLRRLVVVLLAGTVLLAAGCTSDAGSAASGSQPPADPSSHFPTTVHTTNGPVTVDRQPQRVVVLEDQLLETAVAVGVHPVGAPTPTTPLGPWTDGRIERAVRTLPMADGVPVEKVLTLHPDLIVARDYLVDADTYAQLRKIAPTLVLGVDGDGSDTPAWETDARTIGQATGHVTAARRVIGSVRAKIAQARKDHPAIVGKTFQLGNLQSASQFVCTNSDRTSSAQFLRALGLKLATLGGAGADNRVVLSKERFADLDDVDLLIMGSSDAKLARQLAADPLFRRVGPVRHETLDQVDLTWVTAFNIPTALSIPALLHNLAPYLQRL
jgi:iron complex transport system substrate-binding protein